ncbi:universal stress protein [Streptomyces mirabilis]|uniref:universal stress protein n=1 Tax=Streptomyces mirabilis TaxID=68239 RepID=UPI0033A7DF0F
MAAAGQVVVGVSGSLAGLAALRTAVRAARSSGRVLVAVLAREPPEGEVLHAHNPDSAWAARCAREVAARLDRAFEEAFGGTPSEVTVVRRVVRARPDRALCRLAAHPDDRLVIGARARARRAAVRRQVSAHARCPVLTVPAPAFARRERRALRRATARDFADFAAGCPRGCSVRPPGPSWPAPPTAPPRPAGARARSSPWRRP